MCGICGIVQFAGRPRPVVEPDVFERMVDTMVHRGPDDRGVLLRDGVALGARRLSIVDVGGGHQPMSNEDGTVWAAQNGELYNHGRLREDLRARGHRLETRCDTEVLTHLYEEHGPSFPRQLRGMFGVAVWDGRTGTTVVARDRLGIKPLYYAVLDDVVVFASELKAVVASGLVPVDLDYGAIAEYLSLGFFPGPTTPLAAVSKLLPAHALVAGDGGVRVERYWTLPFPDAETAAEGERELAERLLAELEDAVRMRLMSDVPLGAMLSGGLDSSVVVALMARNMSEPVKTFSVGFVEDEENELADARLVARAFGTEHHELELSYREQSISFADLVWHLDEPLADLSSLGFHALSKLAREHVTVALSGQGADELLGGYPAHRNAALAQRYQLLPRPVRRAGALLAGGAPRRLRRAASAVVTEEPALRYAIQAEKLDAELRSRLFRGPLLDVAGRPAEAVAERFLDGRAGGPFPSTLYLYQQLGLVDDMLHYFDRASMANSLEVRVPFLDHELVELCARLPNALKVKGLTRKHLLRVAAADLLPASVTRKRKVGFFNRAASGWLREQADGLLADYLLRPDAVSAELVDTRLLAGLVAGGDPLRSPLLLSLLMLEVWLSEFLPRARAG